MFKKIFEYAGPYKKNMYVATVVVLVSVLMGVLPFVLAYQVISPLVMGDSVETEFVLLRVIGVLICLVLQAVFYGWGLSISHKAAYNTLFRLRVSLQEKFEKLPLGIVAEKGTGTIKKLFVDDVDSLELLLACLLYTSPGEITPEDANRLGCELAKRFTKGNHAYICLLYTS